MSFSELPPEFPQGVARLYEVLLFTAGRFVLFHEMRDLQGDTCHLRQRTTDRRFPVCAPAARCADDDDGGREDLWFDRQQG